MSEIDDGFFDRADEHIHLANDQMSKSSMGKVSASMMYSVTRFNAFVVASGCNSKEEMEASKQGAIKYFVQEYEKMFKENLDDYIADFDSYKNVGKKG